MSDQDTTHLATAPADPYDLGRDGLEALLVDLGQPAYRGRQVHRWLVRGVDDPRLMTDLPVSLRADLVGRFAASRPELLRHVVADDGATHKLLLCFPGGDGGELREAMVETVLMLYARTGSASARATVCVSTQAGCAMGCPFCATGQAGWLHDPDSFGLSARSITVSTVGLVPGIRRLTRMGLPLTLAVSLHAPDDELRDVLVPPNRLHPIGDLLVAVRDHQRATGRRVSFDYVLIDGVNDAQHQARALAELVRDLGSHVNLIPLNPTPGVPRWREPRPGRVRAFARTLRAEGVNATVRDTRGGSVDAACGQLLATYRLGEGVRLPVAAGAAERVEAARAGAEGRLAGGSRS